jgi:hypothetical protein
VFLQTGNNPYLSLEGVAFDTETITSLPSPTVSAVTAPLAYQEFTANVTVSAANPATAQPIVTAQPVTLDGSTPIVIEFYAPGVNPSSAANDFLAVFVEDSAGPTNLGEQNAYNPAAGTNVQGMRHERKLTPSAGTHTFTAKAYRGAGNGIVAAGPGGGAASVPDTSRGRPRHTRRPAGTRRPNRR